MVVFGILLLIHTVFDFIDYQTVFSLWPLILIGLGIELLLSNFAEKRIVYDKAAVVLMIIMIFFTIGMAVADICIEATELYLTNGVKIDDSNILHFTGSVHKHYLVSGKSGMCD